MLNFCPQCGSKLQPAFKFCPSCGERLPEDTTEAVTSQPPEPYPDSVLSSLSAMEGKYGFSSTLFYLNIFDRFLKGLRLADRRGWLNIVKLTG